MLSWKNFLQSWCRQSSSWWVLDVQSSKFVCAGLSNSSFFTFPLPQMRDLPTPETLDPQCKAPLGEEIPSLPLTLGLVASHPQHCRCERKATLPSLPCCCLRPDVTEMPWVSTGAHQMEGHLSLQVPLGLAAFLSQLCEDVPHWHPPGSLVKAINHSISASWLGRHMPELGHLLWHLGHGRILLMKSTCENSNRSLQLPVGGYTSVKLYPHRWHCISQNFRTGQQGKILIHWLIITETSLLCPTLFLKPQPFLSWGKYRSGGLLSDEELKTNCKFYIILIIRWNKHLLARYL